MNNVMGESEGSLAGGPGFPLWVPHGFWFRQQLVPCPVEVRSRFSVAGVFGDSGAAWR